MAYFDPKKCIVVIAEVSPVGLVPIQQYAHTDKEGFALIWGIEKLRLFLQGSKFYVIMDHEA